MRNKLPSSRCSFLGLSAAIATVVVATWATAQQPTAIAPAAAKEPTEAERFAALEKRLTGATLVGNFTVTGRENVELTPERYELGTVEHVEGELWLFQARIRYGEHDLALPLTLPVRWAGDTPVICVDKLGIPGLGTYTARVLIYDDHYAGFWSGGGDHGGHLFGVVERAKAADEPPETTP